MIKSIKEGPIKVNGIEWDFDNYSQEELKDIYDTHPLLQHLFIEVVEEVIEEVIEFIEDKIKKK